jgi:hypothetical protein
VGEGLMLGVGEGDTEGLGLGEGVGVGVGSISSAGPNTTGISRPVVLSSVPPAAGLGSGPTLIVDGKIGEPVVRKWTVKHVGVGSVLKNSPKVRMVS